MTGRLLAVPIAALLFGCGALVSSSPIIGPESAGSFFAGRLPPALPVPSIPADNPISEEKVQLGRRLFYDTRLSGNQTYACATCHEQRYAFTDQLRRAVGSTGDLHPRSSLSLTNVAYNATFGWADSSRRTLEAQMAVPMYNETPVELGLTGRDAEIVTRLSASAPDRERFAAAFPGDPAPVSMPNVVKAIASFERTLLSGDSPLDRYLYRDDRSAISPAARRGMELFFSDRLKCGRCHSGFNLSGPATFEGGHACRSCS